MLSKWYAPDETLYDDRKWQYEDVTSYLFVSYVQAFGENEGHHIPSSVKIRTLFYLQA
jgi:hypothetical protein